MRKRPESLDVSASYRTGSQGHVESSSSTSAGGEVWALRWNAKSAPQVANKSAVTTATGRATTSTIAVVLADCGLEGQGIVPHTARHSLATLELQAGRPVEDVMAILGHSSPSVTLNIYGRRLATPGARASAERHGLRMRRAA